MRKIVSCEFNLDTACVELRLDDGTLLSIDCTAVENEVANSMYQRSELDWLIYNDPLAYAELVLNGDPESPIKKKGSACIPTICMDTGGSFLLNFLFQIPKQFRIEKVLDRDSQTIAEFLDCRNCCAAVSTADDVVYCGFTPLMLQSLLMEILRSLHSSKMRSFTASPTFMGITSFH